MEAASALVATIVGSPLYAGLALVAVLAVLFIASLMAPPPAHGSKATLPNGMTIMQWTPTETNFLYKEIFGEDSEYGRRGVVRFKPGAVIVDAGANIGMFSLYAAQRCRGDATILAFEPIPTTHAVLSANAASAMRGEYDAQFNPVKGAASSLSIVTPPFGLSEAEGSLTMAHHPHLSIWSTGDEALAEARLARVEEDVPRAVANSPNPLVRWLIPQWLARCCARTLLRAKLGRTVKVTVPLKPLSHFIAAHRLPVIDLLKVDVEGAEMQVLKGVSESQWPLVQQVVAEVESFAESKEMCAFLKARGFNTLSRATERERNPGVQSEVSMVYAVRPGYAAAADGVASPSVAAAGSGRRSPSPASARSRGQGRGRGKGQD